MKRSLLLFLCVWVGLTGVAAILAAMPEPAQAAPQAELRVCKTGGGNFSSIQDAIDAAQPGDLIKVAAGVYTETKTAFSFQYNLYITKTVHIFGGYTCSDWATQNETVNLTTIRPANPAFAVVTIEGQYGQGAQLTPTLDGFTISGAVSDNHGGGLRMNDANALIRHNTITGNRSYLLGGGVWVQRGAPVFEANHIENNVADGAGQFALGGGIELESTQAILIGNVIANNSASTPKGYGGGIAIDGGAVNITGNVVMSNTATTLASGLGYGGGVYASASRLLLDGNLIQNNTASQEWNGYGGGVYIENTPSFTLTNNSLLNNTGGYALFDGPYLSGGGIQIKASQGRLVGNIIHGNLSNRNTVFGNGGGLAAANSTLTIQGGEIANNKVSTNCDGYGGGLYFDNSSLTLDGTLIESNCAANTPFGGEGGGLAFTNSRYTLSNALIVQNFAFPNDTAVGGIYAGANSSGNLYNNSLISNYGQGVRSASPITLTNNIILGHTTGISLTAGVAISATYNDFYANTVNQRGFTLHLSNIVINPQLNASYHLLPGSPAIDAGTRTQAPLHDLDGEARPMMGASGLFRFDIGADEFSGAPQIVNDLNQGGDLTIIGPGNPPENPNSNGSSDWIGYSVLGGDLSGDGRDDLLFSAQDWAEDFDTLNATGRIFGFVNFGARITGTLDLLTDTQDITVTSRYLVQHIGEDLASGDLNGDGTADLIIGANNDDNTGLSTPTVFVLWGGAPIAGSRTLTDTSPADFMLVAPAGDYFSYAAKNALASANLNGDGAADLVVGDDLADDGAAADSGAVFVMFGGAGLSGRHGLSATPADFTLYGPAANARLGALAVGRMNGDAAPDLVARSDTQAYVILGPLSNGAQHLADSPADITITGLSAGGVFLMDLTGDGQSDLLLGSGSNLYLIPGPLQSGQTFDVSSRATLTITGVDFPTFAAGDILGDSRPDLILGLQSLRQVYVLSGGLATSGTQAATDIASLIVETNRYRNLGFDVGAGDLDRDGRDDLLIGAFGAGINSHPPKFRDAGAVFVVYGQKPSGSRVYLPLVIKGP